MLSGALIVKGDVAAGEAVLAVNIGGSMYEDGFSRLLVGVAIV